MIARLLVGGLLASTVLVGTPAQAAGCQRLATGLPGSGGCQYEASGPGFYFVSTVSGFRVQYKRGSDPWKTVAAKTAIANNPASGIAVESGPIPTIAGDIVDISIGTATIYEANTNNTIRYMDGFIAANDNPS